ncbi:TRAP-type C4-dicarboxylate transport system permease small subunit [Azospirillum agricola]|uniref:TRAP transporter small permease n=1 Tax=Azospirillum agricola TaxID=1720247 RepID=UPI001AE66EE8|nr:TRAP transporter small permease [Azospirillum agricola]MBP2230966.1 TRAP-type C4-dicarboxylate transport system permease small subunit [Azospirillum agricola]
MKASPLPADGHGAVGPAPVSAGPAPLPPALRRVIRVVDGFNAALLAVLSLGLGVLACLALVQVIARYVVGEPLIWSEELIRYALIWIVFLGAGIGVRRGLLASVELIAQTVPRPLRRALSLVCALVSALFWAVLLGYGVAILDAVEGITSGNMEIPMSVVYLAVPIGAALALVNTLIVAIDPPPPSLDGIID